MEKLLFMKCHRCRGGMIYDKFYGPHEQFWGWKCLICGEIVDSVILENRQLMRAGQVTNLRRARRYKKDMGKTFGLEKYNSLLSAESYLRQINQFPLLTPEEEFKLAARYRKCNDREAAEKLVTSNLRFVVKVALEYKTYGIKLSDLIQEGNIGLMMALKKFNPYKRYRLISYAVWWIRAYIRNFIIKSWSLVKIGTTQAQKKLFYRIGKVRKALEADGESEAKYEHLASDLYVTKDDIVEMEQRMAARDLSLDSPLDDDHELTHLDLLQESSLNQEESLALEEEKKIRDREVLSAMKHLNQREEYVIKNRIMSDSSLTLQEIGNHLKLSRERVRQIESEALKKLRKEMSPGLEPRA